MKHTLIGLTAVLLWYCSPPKQELDGKQILQNSIAKHDPHHKWNTAELNVHIQEPRIANPYRYSMVKLNNSKNTFELSRNRDDHISLHVIESDGSSTVFLDGKAITDSSLVKKYGLYPDRNIRYKNFYFLLLGLPMSLDSAHVKEFGKAIPTTFNGRNSLKVEVELKEEVFSRFWNIYVSQKDLSILGVEIVFPEDERRGERIYFDEIIAIDSMSLPRIRNWHNLSDDTYSGTDIIIKELVN